MNRFPSARLIMFHKQSTSARTRFLQLAYGGVCAFEGLPALAQALDEPPASGKVALHPGKLLHAAETWIGMESGSLEAEAGFKAWVDVPGGPVQVFLARFTAIDPPFEHAEARGARFIDLTQARGLPVAELALLRQAYELVLGG